MLRIGTKVRVCQCSGVDSGRTGRVVSPRKVKTDGHCVPKIIGHYKPVNWRKESAVLDNNGNLFTMFDNRLRIEV